MGAGRLAYSLTSLSSVPHCVSQHLPLQISDPRTEGGTLTSYTSYHVSCTLLPDGVRRRYSDFDWLRDILVGVCPNDKADVGRRSRPGRHPPP